MHVGWCDYGKWDIPVLAVDRRSEGHVLREIDVTVRFEGDIQAAYTHGDNSSLLPTRTMTDTVYVLVRRHIRSSLERLAIALTTHFLRVAPPAQLIEVRLAETPWMSLDLGGTPDGTGFKQAGRERKVATVLHRRDSEPLVTSGCAELYLLKTTGSSFIGFLHDEYTVLPDRHDRVLGALFDIEWTYRGADLAFDAARDNAYHAVVTAFSSHTSLSTQHTLHVLASACLSSCPDIQRVQIGIKHIDPQLVDLTPFGAENADEVYVMPRGAYGAAHLVLNRTTA